MCDSGAHLRAGVCVGDAVAEMTFSGFADYAVLPARQALPIPHPGPEMIALLTSGLTASIGEVHRMVSIRLLSIRALTSSHSVLLRSQISENQDDSCI